MFFHLNLSASGRIPLLGIFLFLVLNQLFFNSLVSRKINNKLVYTIN